MIVPLSTRFSPSLSESHGPAACTLLWCTPILSNTNYGTSLASNPSLLPALLSRSPSVTHITHILTGTFVLYSLQQKRCSSPSHFNVKESEEVKYGPQFTLDMPQRDLVDSLFRAVSHMYYRPKETHQNGSSVWVSGDYDRLQYPSLDLLISPLRKPSPLGM